MKQKLQIVLVLILGIAGSAAAQSRTVTNADLEKFKSERLKAAAEYRENYARWGFPSPEELDHRREKSRIESEKLSAELRASRLESERLEAQRQTERERSEGFYRNRNMSFDSEPLYNSPSYILSNGRNRLRNRRQPFYQSGYVGGGHFWPTPVVRHVPKPTWLRR